MIGKHNVLFADFKSDARPPAAPDEVPDRTIAQLALYRRALAEALPGRTLRALLIYTSGPKVLEIPAEMLDRTWLRLETQPSLAGPGFVS
jgi:ATP-dependent helicase/nuclease subunit A